MKCSLELRTGTISRNTDPFKSGLDTDLAFVHLLDTYFVQCGLTEGIHVEYTYVHTLYGLVHFASYLSYWKLFIDEAKVAIGTVRGPFGRRPCYYLFLPASHFFSFGCHTPTCQKSFHSLNTYQNFLFLGKYSQIQSHESSVQKDV